MPMVNNINVYRDEAALPQPVLVYANAQGLRTLGHAAYIGVHAGQTQAAQQVVLHQPYRITEGAYDAANNSTTSAVVTVNVGADVTPPTVSLLANPATVLVPGSTTLQASAESQSGAR